MATEEKNTELDDLAFEIFARRIATLPVHRAIERDILDSYRKAEAFLAVKAKVHAEGLKTMVAAIEPPGSDCRAPNLRRNHPLNLVSRVDGDLNKVKQVQKFLAVNPTPAIDPQELVTRLNRSFPDLGWDLPTINVAREIFPAYCKA